MKQFIAFLTSISILAAQSTPQEIHLIPQNEPISLDQTQPLENPIFERPKKSVFLSTALSGLFPGLGHFYLNDNTTGGELLGAELATIGLAVSTRKDPNISIPALATVNNITFYSIYAAYRDTRIYNRNDGYHYQMPTDSFKSLALAPITPSVMKKPEVWGGYLGCMGAAIITTSLLYSTKSEANVKRGSNFRTLPVVAFPVAIGEEAMFRGTLQPMLIEKFGPAGGIALSSMLFGAAHIPNAEALPKEERWGYYTFTIPMLSLIGSYWGWVSYKNNSLKESVAMHAWYDFTLMGLSMLGPKASIPQEKFYSISFAF